MILLAGCVASAPTVKPATEPTVVDPARQGSLVIEQLNLKRMALGESALIVGDGTVVLIDVGNEAHAPDIRAALARHGVTHVDFVVLTHYHADHIGGFDKLFADGDLTFGEVIWRGPVNLEDANIRELAEVQARAGPGLCNPVTCDLPYQVQVGPATLTIFLADGVVATEAGPVELMRGMRDENARSLGGVLTWGAFDFLFAGDLTGGGKGTPDLEGAVVAARPGLPAIDVLQMNHHGISSSSSVPWANLLGEGDTNVVVGANNTYLDAPSEEALAAFAPHLGSGHVWVTEDGLLGNRDAKTVVAHGPVTITVEGGERYSIEGGGTQGTWAAIP